MATGGDERMIEWSMYMQIQNLKSLGFKKSQVANQLGINRETVSTYWDMPPDEFQAKKNKRKARKPDVYKELIVDWLTKYPDISSAQLYDWCKERSLVETLDFQQRSFRDYVKSIREEYDIKKPCRSRQYEAVDELPPGEQSQVDMGEILVETASGRHRKVYCFAMVLAHSRYKFVWWQLKPFTTETFIQAHEKAFEFFGGRTREIVYDQDKVLAVSENSGDIIYTADFQAYINEVKFSVYLCRGADPESKGKVENVVKYAKHGFAEHRILFDIDSFNEDCIKWLNRTANKEIHGTTQKRPVEVFAAEKDYLLPVFQYHFDSVDNESIDYPVRKDNIVIYKGNRYRVPKGTYTPYVRVFMIIDEEKDTVAITDTITGEIYAKHPLCHTKGELVGRQMKRRDTSKSIAEQESLLKELFDDDELVGPFLDRLHQEKPRYYRDQLIIIRKLFESYNAEVIKDGLRYCNEHDLHTAGELKSSIIYLTQYYLTDRKNKSRDGTALPEKYRGDKPELRDLSVYEAAMEERGAI